MSSSPPAAAPIGQAAAASRAVAPGPLPSPGPGEGTEAIAILDGIRHRFVVPPGGHVVDAALAQGIRVPYSCKGGMCCTCRAKLVEGEAAMTTNYSLEPWEIERGFILTCQAVPNPTGWWSTTTRCRTRPRHRPWPRARCARSISSSTSRRLSLPKKISSPTKNVGEPKVPRATELSVFLQQRVLDALLLDARQDARAVEAGGIERGADDLGLVHLLGLLPHVAGRRST